MTDIRDPSALASAIESADARTYRSLFAELVEAYRAPIYALAYRITGDPHEADDVAQETFVAVYEHLRSFRGEAQVYTWIYRIAVRIARRRLRERSRRADRAGDADADLADPGPSPDRRAIGSELGRALDRAMAELPEKQRVALALFSIDGLSAREVADVLEIEVGTVWSRVHYARTNLADELSEHLD